MARKAPKRLSGWHRNKPDPRDTKMMVRASSSRPKAYSNRAICSKVEDQGGVGSCVGNATVALMESLLIKEINAIKAAGKKPPTFVELSRLFVYYWARKIGGYPVTEDTGCQIRDALKALVRYGVCTESLHVYGDTPDFWSAKPNAAAVKDATKHHALAYACLGAGGPPSVGALETVLAGGNLVAFGFSVPEGFESIPASGLMPPITKGTRYEGGHAVAAIGYNSANRLVEVRNSWGTKWGDKGHFWMPYESMFNAGICDDFQVIYKEDL